MFNFADIGWPGACLLEFYIMYFIKMVFKKFRNSIKNQIVVGLFESLQTIHSINFVNLPKNMLEMKNNSQ